MRENPFIEAEILPSDIGVENIQNGMNGMEKIIVETKKKGFETKLCVNETHAKAIIEV